MNELQTRLKVALMRGWIRLEGSSKGDALGEDAWVSVDLWRPGAAWITICVFGGDENPYWMSRNNVNCGPVDYADLTDEQSALVMLEWAKIDMWDKAGRPKELAPWKDVDLST